MHILYRLFLNFAIALFMTNLYLKIRNSHHKNFTIATISICYAIIRLSISDYLPEPLSIISSFLFFFLALSIVKKKVVISNLIVVFMISYTLWLCSALLSVIIIFVVGTTNESWFMIISALSLTTTLGTAFRFLSRPKFNLYLYGAIIEDALIQKMIWVICSLIIILYSTVNISATLDFALDPSFSIFVWFFFTTVIATIILLTFFIVKHLDSEMKKQRSLTFEKTDIQNRLSELSLDHDVLQKDLGKVTSDYHNFKYVIPVLMNMQQKLIEDIGEAAANKDHEKIQRIKEYTSQVQSLSAAINNDLNRDKIKIIVESLEIPNPNAQVNALLEQLLITAEERHVYLSIYNNTSTWPEQTADLLRLISNIVDNALKESQKIAKEKRGEVRLEFSEQEGYFVFTVMDSANEFDLNVLKKLGKRKNSINNTGDGYFEIMTALRAYGASFIITEWQQNNKKKKIIKVSLDECSMRIIDSSCRSEQLHSALSETEFEIINSRRKK